MLKMLEVVLSISYERCVGEDEDAGSLVVWPDVVDELMTERCGVRLDENLDRGRDTRLLSEVGVHVSEMVHPSIEGIPGTEH